MSSRPPTWRELLGSATARNSQPSSMEQRRGVPSWSLTQDPAHEEETVPYEPFLTQAPVSDHEPIRKNRTFDRGLQTPSRSQQMGTFCRSEGASFDESSLHYQQTLLSQHWGNPLGNEGQNTHKEGPGLLSVGLEHYAKLFVSLTGGGKTSRVRPVDSFDENKYTRNDLKQVLMLHRLSDGSKNSRKDILHGMVGMEIFCPFRSSSSLAPDASMSAEDCEMHIRALGWLDGKVSSVDVIRVRAESSLKGSFSSDTGKSLPGGGNRETSAKPPIAQEHVPVATCTEKSSDLATCDDMLAEFLKVLTSPPEEPPVCTSQHVSLEQCASSYAKQSNSMSNFHEAANQHQHKATSDRSGQRGYGAMSYLPAASVEGRGLQGGEIPTHHPIPHSTYAGTQALRTQQPAASRGKGRLFHWISQAPEEQMLKPAPSLKPTQPRSIPEFFTPVPSQNSKNAVDFDLREMMPSQFTQAPVTQSTGTAPQCQKTTARWKKSILHKLARDIDVHKINLTPAESGSTVKRKDFVLVALLEELVSAPSRGRGQEKLPPGLYTAEVGRALSNAHDSELCPAGCQDDHLFFLARIPLNKTHGKGWPSKSKDAERSLELKVDLHQRNQVFSWDVWEDAICGESQRLEDCWMHVKGRVVQPPQINSKKRVLGLDSSEGFADGEVVWCLDGSCKWPAKIHTDAEGVDGDMIVVEFFGSPKLRKEVLKRKVQRFEIKTDHVNPRKHSKRFREAVEEAMVAAQIGKPVAN